MLKSPVAKYKNEPLRVTLPYGDKRFVPVYRQLGWSLTHHNGTDIVNSVDPFKAYGSPVLATQNGIVQSVEFTTPVSTKGNGVRIQGDQFAKNGKRYILIEIHWHMASVWVKAGERVKVGQQIGKLGNSGYSIGGGISPMRGCYDKETEVLTNEGWKLFKNLNNNESFATLNLNSGIIEYQKATNRVKYRHQYIFKYKGKTIDLAISEKHNLIVFTSRKNKEKLKLTNLSNLPTESNVPLIAGKWIGKEQEYFYLPSVIKLNNDAKYKTDEIKVKMDDWLWFLGWFFSDGSWHDKKDKNGSVRYIINISQSLSNKKKREEIECCLNGLPFNWHKSKGTSKSRAVSFTIFNKQLCKYLKQFKKRGEKRLPGFIEYLSPRQIKIFLDAFARGDGWRRKEGTMIYEPGTSKIMADQLQVLLMKTNQRATILKKKGKKANWYYSVSTRLHKRGRLVRNKIKKEYYNDYVYCVEVPNHTLYVRRNGKPMWCGNTHNHFGIYEYVWENDRWVLSEPNNGVKGAVNPEKWLSPDWKETAPLYEPKKFEHLSSVASTIAKGIEYIKNLLKGR